MMVALYILMGIVGALLVLVFIKAESLLKTNRDIVGELQRIVEGQRLSMVFDISPQSLTINPADFEPQRPILHERLMKAFETEKHPNPGTLAYCILENSGWRTFVDGKTFQSAKTALGRLLANKNTGAAEEFIGTLVDQL